MEGDCDSMHRTSKSSDQTNLPHEKREMGIKPYPFTNESVRIGKVGFLQWSGAGCISHNPGQVSYPEGVGQHK